MIFSGGWVTVQSLPVYPDGHLLYKPPAEKNAWVEIPFEVEKKEPRRLLLVMTRSYDFGKYQACLNGVKLGGVIDLYSSDILSREYEPVFSEHMRWKCGGFTVVRYCQDIYASMDNYQENAG
jgi:hypothetical protein